MTSLNFLSPDSKSYAFDERANGYARGEGTSVVVLKPLKQALKDGDTIRAGELSSHLHRADTPDWLLTRATQ